MRVSAIGSSMHDGTISMGTAEVRPKARAAASEFECHVHIFSPAREDTSGWSLPEG